MDTTLYKVYLRFTEPLLGTAPKSPEIYTDYIASKAPPDTNTSDELESAPDDLENKGWTGFHTNPETGQVMLYDYVIKGYMKEVCSHLRRVPNSKSHGLKAHKKVINGLVFPQPRRIDILLPEEQKLEVVERSLRAQTAQGERVALARSDAAPIGSVLEFNIKVYGSTVRISHLAEWFGYGEDYGLGQWRNSGMGRFVVEELFIVNA